MQIRRTEDGIKQFLPENSQVLESMPKIINIDDYNTSLSTFITKWGN